MRHLEDLALLFIIWIAIVFTMVLSVLAIISAIAIALSPLVLLYLLLS